MNCAEFQEIVHEFGRGDARETLGESTEVMARLHAQICETCAGSLAEAQVLAKALADTAEETKLLEAPAGMEERLAGAFREHHRNLERVPYRERRARLRWVEWAGLAAAAIALAAIGAWNFSRGRVVKNTNTAPITASGPVKSGINGATTDTAGDMQTAEEEADFVPVPYGESLSADDPGMVVRVSMTRGALESLGYPIDEVNASEVIQADVLVGEDGLPVAVRLVQ